MPFARDLVPRKSQHSAWNDAPKPALLVTWVGGSSPPGRAMKSKTYKAGREISSRNVRTVFAMLGSPPCQEHAVSRRWNGTSAKTTMERYWARERCTMGWSLSGTLGADKMPPMPGQGATTNGSPGICSAKTAAGFATVRKIASTALSVTNRNCVAKPAFYRARRSKSAA